MIEKNTRIPKENDDNTVIDKMGKANLSKQKKLATKSRDGFDKEYARQLLLEGNDEEIVEYFEKFGIPKDEVLRRKRQFQDDFKKKMFQGDLNEILKEFPFVTATDIKDIPNYNEFVKFRKLGLSAKDSFKAVNADYIIEGKTKNRIDNSDYSHMASLGVNGKSSKNVPIPEDVLSIWKSAFPKDNLTELTKKYNQQRTK